MSPTPIVVFLTRSRYLESPRRPDELRASVKWPPDTVLLHLACSKKLLVRMKISSLGGVGVATAGVVLVLRCRAIGVRACSEHIE